MGYTVKMVADLAGVSVRTLHHYDQIGLLKPASRNHARYRFYGEAELLRLQQILFFSERTTYRSQERMPSNSRLCPCSRGNP